MQTNENAIEHIPVTEPERQYYFIEKCKDYVRKISEELRRPLTAAVITFGCQMNARDSEKLTGILEKIGYTMIDQEEKADFVIYNTCTVRENANQRVYGRLGQLNRVKRKNPHMLIGLCGCMMQEPHVVERLKKSYRFVDLIFGTHNIYKFAEVLATRFESERMVIDIWKDTDRIVEDLPSERKYSFKSGVNIMFGCNNFCSYCIVPYVRGRERSRNPRDIIREIENLAADGVKEVMLLGQNVNSYGKTLEEPMTFAELLREVEKIDGLERIRFMTSHPKDLSDELIEVMRTSKKICHHLHLPVQSGSTEILKKMNRKTTGSDIRMLLDKIRTRMPNVFLRTSLIAGFPGETEEQFEELCEFVKEAKFDRLGCFAYSQEEGTPAASMPDQIDEEEKQRRADIIMQEQMLVNDELVKYYLGRSMEIVVEGYDRYSEMWYGRCAAQAPEIDGKVFFTSPRRTPSVGEYVAIKAEDYIDYDLIGMSLGRMSDEPTQ